MPIAKVVVSDTPRERISGVLFLYQLWCKRFGGDDVIRRDAGLAAVAAPLARSDPLGSNLHSFSIACRFNIACFFLSSRK
jgi:hypothetical protein